MAKKAGLKPDDLIESGLVRDFNCMLVLDQSEAARHRASVKVAS
jgi:hypothetical protein